MFFLELDYVLPIEGDLVDGTKFLQEDLEEIIPLRDRINR